MNETINRQPQGIPAGGQFAVTAHAEPGVTLAPEVPAYDHEAQQERLTAISEKRQAMDRLQTEMDLLNVDAAIASVRKYFPEATELHIDHRRHGWTGELLDDYEPKSLRDKDGNDITAEEPKWFYRREPGSDGSEPLVSNHLWNIGRGFFGHGHEGVSYDPETGHRVIDMNHKFSA